MQAFITSVEQLKETVKVNNNEYLFTSLLPYLDDAFEKYIVPYLGDALIDRLTAEGATVQDLKVSVMVRRALGPLAVAMASPELGILIGDSGHTVTRTDKVTVASDEKIGRAEASMQERGWMNLERMLDYLDGHLEEFPEWKESRYMRDLSTGRYLNSAREFQDMGKVNINYSRLTYETFRPLLDRLEMSLRRRLGSGLDDKLRAEIKEPGNVVMQELIEYIRLWLAANVAQLYTSQTTRLQRATPGVVEFKPVIYPLFGDVTDTGNYYAGQVKELDAIISDFMLRNATELGLPDPVKNDFNSIDKHIFVS